MLLIGHNICVNSEVISGYCTEIALYGLTFAYRKEQCVSFCINWEIYEIVLITDFVRQEVLKVPHSSEQQAYTKTCKATCSQSCLTSLMITLQGTKAYRPLFSWPILVKSFIRVLCKAPRHQRGRGQVSLEISGD